jgi:hypothetical protein
LYFGYERHPARGQPVLYVETAIFAMTPETVVRSCQVGRKAQGQDVRHIYAGNPGMKK